MQEVNNTYTPSNEFRILFLEHRQKKQAPPLMMNKLLAKMKEDMKEIRLEEQKKQEWRNSVI